MKNFLFGFMILPALVGMVFVYHTLLSNKSDGKTGQITNRVARVELAWLSINKPHLFINIMPELTMDIKEQHKFKQRMLLKSSAFDYHYFIANNPDLSQIIAQGKNKVVQYWLNNLFECRKSSPSFNVKIYQKRYQDVMNKFGSDCELATYHWFEYGIDEGRLGI